MSRKQLFALVKIYLSQFHLIKLLAITSLVTTIIILGTSEIGFNQDSNFLKVIIDIHSIPLYNNLFKILIWLCPYVIFCSFLGLFLSNGINYEYLIPRTNTRSTLFLGKVLFLIILNVLYVVCNLAIHILVSLFVTNSSFSMSNFINVMCILFILVISNITLTFFQFMLSEYTNNNSLGFFVVSILLVFHCFNDFIKTPYFFINTMTLNRYSLFSNNLSDISFIGFLISNTISISIFITFLFKISTTKNIIPSLKEI